MQIDFFQRASLSLWLLFILLPPFPLIAEEIRDYYAEPGLNPFQHTRDSLNESIDPFSGTLQHRYVDMEIPGNGGMDIVVNRVYTSRQRTVGPTNPLGIGWTMHFGRIVVPTTHRERICSQGIYSVSSNDNPSIEFPDGRRELLVVNDVDDTHELITRSNWKASCQGVDSGMRVFGPDGRVYYMDKAAINVSAAGDHYSWYTTRIEDVHGNAIDISYIDNLGDALIDEVSASDGRRIKYRYKNLGFTDVRLRSITDVASGTGQKVTYHHSPVAGYPNHRYLKRVSHTDGSLWRYRYYAETDREQPEQYSLKRVTYPYGGKVTYTYDAIEFDKTQPNSLGTSVIKTKKINGPNISPGLWSYEYFPGEIGEFDKTIVNTPAGREEYLHQGLNSGGAIVWPIGLLMRKETYSLDNALLESIHNTWDKRYISYENWTHGRGRTDNDTSTPILLSTAYNRDGNLTTTTYEDHDIYGNPGRKIESCSLEDCADKVTELTYYTNLETGIIGFEQDIHVLGEGWTYRNYLANGLLQSEQVYGVTTSYTYTPQGDLDTKTDARNFRERHSDYYRGTARQVEQEVETDEWIVNLKEVNPTGTIESTTNGRGIKKSFAYDSLNRLTGIDYPINADATISYGLDASMYRRNRRLSRGAYKQTETYDGFGRIVALVREDTHSGESILTTTVYDALGRKQFESNPNSALGRHYTHDALGRLVRMENSDGSFRRYEYGTFLATAEGFHADKKEVDENGSERFLLHHAYGSPDNILGVATVITLENVTQFYRSSIGSLLWVGQGDFLPANPGAMGNPRIRLYHYDDRKYLTGITHPETGTTTFGRDEVGNRISSTVGASETTNYQYDGLNRLKYVDYPPGTEDVTIHYDGNGNRTIVSNRSAEWRYDYDHNDNLREERIVLASESNRQLVLGYQHDSLDNLASTTFPNDHVVDYLPNAFGRPTKAGNYVDSASYHASGQIASLALSNGVTTSWAQDDRLRVSGIETGIIQSEILSLGYGYDGTGNTKTINDAHEPANNLSLSYDILNRLRTANGVWGSSEYTYTATGDIKRKIVNDETYHYHYDNTTQQLIDISPYTTPTPRFNYDGYGNMIYGDRNLGYRYNHASELVAADWDADGVDDIYMGYDGNGHRLYEIDMDEQRGKLTMHDTTGRLLFEELLTECRETNYIYLGTTLVAKRESDAVLDANSDGIVDCQQTDGLVDTDFDGMPDVYELRYGLNPQVQNGQLDLDGDTLTNLEEYLAGTSPDNPDTDNDFMPDAYEIDNQLDPLVDDRTLDLDGDGFSNYSEYAAGTDPDNANDMPSLGLRNILAGPIVPVDGGSIFVGSVAALTKYDTIIGQNQFVTDGASWYLPTAYGESYPTPLLETGFEYFSQGPHGGGHFTVDDDGQMYVMGGGSLKRVGPDWRAVWEAAPEDADTQVPGVIGVNNIYLHSPEWQSGLRAISKETGEILWQRDAGTWSPVTAAPGSVGENDTLFIPVTDPDDPALIAYDAAGNLLWELALEGVPNQPAIGFDGSLYVTTVRMQLDLVTQEYISSPGRLYAIDANGAELWSQELPFIAEAVIIGMEDILYVSGSGPIVQTYDSAGNTLWSFQPAGLSGRFYRPVIGADGAAYFVHGTPDPSLEGHVTIAVYAVDIDGIQIWSETNLPGRYYEARSAMHTPVITSDGTLYFWATEWQCGSNPRLGCYGESPYLFAFNTQSGGVASSAWPGAYGGVQRVSRINTCDEGDQDNDGVMDCADTDPPASVLPLLEVDAPASGSYRYYIQKRPFSLGDTCAYESLVLTHSIRNEFNSSPNCGYTSTPAFLPDRYSSPIFYAGESVTLTAAAIDPQSGDIGADIEWYSDTAGLLGTGPSVTIDLAEGAHMITAQVEDIGGNSASQVVNLYAKRRPSISIASPPPFSERLTEEVIDMPVVTHPAGAPFEAYETAGFCSAYNLYDNDVLSVVLGAPGYCRVDAVTTDPFWDTATASVQLVGVGEMKLAGLTMSSTSVPRDTQHAIDTAISYAGGIAASGVRNYAIYSDIEGLLGTNATGRFSVSFSETGMHNITVTATDALGQSDSISTTVDVTGM